MHGGGGGELHHVEQSQQSESAGIALLPLDVCCCVCNRIKRNSANVVPTVEWTPAAGTVFGVRRLSGTSTHAVFHDPSISDGRWRCVYMFACIIFLFVLYSFFLLYFMTDERIIAIEWFNNRIILLWYSRVTYVRHLERLDTARPI